MARPFIIYSQNILIDQFCTHNDWLTFEWKKKIFINYRLVNWRKKISASFFFAAQMCDYILMMFSMEFQFFCRFYIQKLTTRETRKNSRKKINKPLFYGVGGWMDGLKWLKILDGSFYKCFFFSFSSICDSLTSEFYLVFSHSPESTNQKSPDLSMDKNFFSSGW